MHNELTYEPLEVAEVAELHEENGALRRELAALKQALHASQRELSLTAERLHEAEGMLAEADAGMATLRESEAYWHEVAEDLRLEANQLRVERDTAERGVRSLRHELDAERAAAAQFRDERNDVIDELDRLGRLASAVMKAGPGFDREMAGMKLVQEAMAVGTHQRRIDPEDAVIERSEREAMP